MTYPTPLLLLLAIGASASDSQTPTLTLPAAVPDLNAELDALRAAFGSQPLTPALVFDLEQQLEVVLRGVGRTLLETWYNALAAQVDAASARVQYEGEEYRRLKTPTANRHVATLFGTITLQRQLFRCTRRDAGEASIAPAEMALGLSHGATPALAEAATRSLAAAGATQQAVLTQLKQRHDVTMGAERLRALAADRAAALAASQTAWHAERLLTLLHQAEQSRGRHRPVLSVGRDGVTVRQYRWRFFECASVGTLTVYDRRGQRLGTVYLGCVPETKQTTMSQRLTALLHEVLRRYEGPLPRLCYVTDAGENETQYYQQVLRTMCHPRTQVRLKWQRIIDFYHTMERLWTMAELLFGASRAGTAWVKRMGTLLKKRNGPFRVLHAAAALRARAKLSKHKRGLFERAYNYLRQRTKWLQYHDYAKQGLPLGSGVTEAACKTLVAQRLKLSGMRWTKAGGQVILDLRATLLSGTWEAANRALLSHLPQPQSLSPDASRSTNCNIAA